MEMPAAVLKNNHFYSDADGEHHFNAKENKDKSSSDSLAHTNETLDSQMADENGGLDSGLEDHIDHDYACTRH